MIIKGNSNLEVIKLSGSDFRICAILIPNSGNKKVTFKVLIHANREYALGIVMRSFFAASMYVISWVFTMCQALSWDISAGGKSLPFWAQPEAERETNKILRYDYGKDQGKQERVGDSIGG